MESVSVPSKGVEMCIRDSVTEEVSLEAVRKDAGVLYDIPQTAITPLVADTAAVSYTHLDVYKRQAGHGQQYHDHGRCRFATALRPGAQRHPGRVAIREQEDALGRCV